MSPETDLVCTTAALSRLFPFHLLLSDDLTIVGAGPALTSVMPQAVGRPFEAHFRVTRPELESISYRRLASLGNTLTALAGDHGLPLQGQFEPLANGMLLFACSLTVTDVETLSRLGLTVQDFAPHDSAGDFLLLLQSTKTNMADLERVSASLRAERSELRKVRVQLEDALVASRANEKLLGESERRYKNVVDTVKEVIFQTDGEGRWTFLNPAWTETLGYSIAESLGRSFLDYVHPDDRDRNVQAFLPLIQKQKDSCRHEVRYVSATGESRWIEVFARLLLDGTGAARGTAGTLNDVTDRHAVMEHLTESHREMEQAKSLADAANQAKSDFLATMSHEIRTPLHTLLGMTDLLAESTLSPEQQRLLRSVQSSADVLKCLVSDLLDLAKIEQQQIDLHTTPFSPWDLVESVAELVAVRAHGKDVDVICAISPALPVSLRGDAARIRQILLNLASNAVKFTEHGEVVVAAEFDRAGEAPGVLRLSVSDTGIGIPVEDQPRVFERFGRARNSKRVGGTGLGLHISRSLIERMGGAIRFTSTPGQGSRFVASIPCDVLQPAVAAEAPGETSPVLIASPSAATRDALATPLKAAGYPVVMADTAEAAAALQRGEFRVVLLDRRCSLPQSSLSKSTRVITVHRLGDVVSPGNGASVDIPTRAAALLAAVRGDQPPSALRMPAAPARAPARRATILVVEDNHDAQEFALRALGGAGHKVDIAATGAAAIARVAQRQYDLIFMDLQLPDLSGIEVTRRIRAAEKESQDEDVPIVAVTAHAMAQYKDECLAAGMNCYLTKPLSGGRLRAAVEQWMDVRDAVLVADDSPDSQLMVRRALTKVGLRTVTAHNGMDALRQMDRQPVAAAILDVTMPVMDGPATLRAIRDRADGRVLPVVAVSGVENGARRATMMSLGCAAYLVKPVDAATLSRAVVEALRSETHEPAKSPLRIEEVSDDLADLAPGYIAARQQDVIDARNAALEEEFERIESIGHNMKGTGTSYGFPAISRLGRALEDAAVKRDVTQIAAILAELDEVLNQLSANWPSSNPTASD